MYETFPKAAPGKISGYRSHGPMSGSQAREVGFHETQGVFAKRPEAEIRDVYSKPGTTKAFDEEALYGVSMPTSRFRSARP